MSLVLAAAGAAAFHVACEFEAAAGVIVVYLACLFRLAWVKSPRWAFYLGLGICYDLSYGRVMDRLVEAGAQALIIPAMDAEDWGEHEHRLHSKVAPVRAREYGIPIFRLASSGISQHVDRRGRVIASAPFPGQGERLAGKIIFAGPGSLPLDRYLALPAVAAVASLLLYLAVSTLSLRLRRLH